MDFIQIVSLVIWTHFNINTKYSPVSVGQVIVVVGGGHGDDNEYDRGCGGQGGVGGGHGCCAVTLSGSGGWSLQA